MSISSLNTNLLSQNAVLTNSTSSNASLQTLGTALSGGDLPGAKNIFSSLSQNSSSVNTDATTQTLMGQLGNAINGGNVLQAQQITSALQTLQNQGSTTNTLFGDSTSGANSSGLNDSLFSALSLTGVDSGSATSLAGITSPSASGMVSPAQEIAQNMDNFLNSLLTTLKAQSSSSSSGSTSTNTNTSKQNPYVATSSNQMSSGLQGLIMQLAKDPGAASAINTTGTTSNSNSSATNDPNVSELQASYDKLINSQGGSGGSSSLISFLENFESNMKSMQSSGGFLNVNA